MTSDPATDPFNVASVKLAEATRIRLYLPGLNGLDIGAEGAASLGPAGPGANAGDAIVSRRTARKLQKAAKWVAQVSGEQYGLQQGAASPQVFLEPDEDESEDDGSSSDTEQSAGAAGLTGDNRHASGSGVGRKNEPGTKSSSHGGPNLVSGSKGQLKPSPMKSRTASMAGMQPPEPPRIPIWERPTAPPGGVAVREVLAAAAAPKVYKAVVAKTFSLGADTGRPLTYECNTDGDARFATNRKVVAITVNCAPTRPSSTPHPGPHPASATTKPGQSQVAAQQQADMPLSPGRQAARPVATPPAAQQRATRTPPTSNPLLSGASPSRPAIARAFSQASLGGGSNQDSSDLALVPTSRADSCSSLMGRKGGGAHFLPQEFTARIASTSPGRRVPLLTRLYQPSKDV